VPPPGYVDAMRSHDLLSFRNLALAFAFVVGVGGVGGCAIPDDDASDASDASDDEAANAGSETSDEGTPAVDDGEPAEAPDPVVETVAEGFDGAWGLAFLPDGEQLLVTEVGGTLNVVDVGSGDVREIDGVPEVDTGGQGGLLDVAVGPEADWLYLTYSASDGSGATATHLARGRLDLAQGRLDDLEVLFVAEPFLGETVHYGSRVEFGSDGHLFMTVGDRGDKNFDDHRSQDTSNTHGTTIRLMPDGSVPDDNPFVGDDGVADEIYSYGHRNVQGMAVNPGTGELWQGEHGEEDGDEINIVEAGGNYGWPEVTTACEYGTDTPVGERHEDRDDVVAPVYFWECGTGGFPPAGMAFYEGDEFPAWQGDLFVGGLASQYLARFAVDGREVDEPEALLEDEGWRIRDVAVGPQDGAVYLAIDDEDAPLVRLVDGTGD
jgi:aldose sugar dehydrogenase